MTRGYRDTGTVAPKPHGGGAIAKLGVSQLPIVKALVEAQPDALLEELCERFANKSGVTVSVSTTQRTIRRLQLSVKKTLIASEQKTQRLKELSSAKARTRYALDQALTKIINEGISSDDAPGWFNHFDLFI